MIFFLERKRPSIRSVDEAIPHLGVCRYQLHHTTLADVDWSY